MIIAGKKLSQFKNWTFCLVIGILECSLIPVGAILGLFTVIILRRKSVVELFSESSHNVSPSTKTEQINAVESHREAKQSQQTQNTGQYEDMAMPTTYLWQSIAVTLLCCLPVGIPAIIYAAKTNANNDAGNMEKAYNASRKARMWCLIAFAMGLIPLTIILISEWISFLH